MGFRDRLIDAGSALAGVAGDVLVGAGGILQKAVDESPSRAPGGKNEDTAKNAPVPTEKATDEPKSLLFDPFTIIEQLGYRDKPSQVSYGTLKAMVFKTHPVGAVIQTRLNQLAAFTVPSHDRYTLGYRVKVREKEKEPTKAEKQWSQQAESLIMRTGVTDNPRGRDNFEKFIRKIGWDSLVYDQMCFEIVPNRKGQPAEWYAVDSATIRQADTATTYMNEDVAQATRYVQIYDGTIISEYTQEELCFGVRNPRTDIRLYGYGISELEMMMTAVTAWLWGYEYNQKAFSQGSVHKGILNFKGAIPEKQLRSFRRQWYTQLATVSNAWRTPITNAEDLQWISMHQSSRDMEYNAWMDFIIKILCAFYSMDPIEINFKYGNVGQKGGLSEQPNREKIVESKERGLRPLLKHIASCINHYIIWPLNENFEFEFVGLDAKTHEEQADLATKQVKTTRMVDELRAEDDLPPLPDGLGQVILDPTWLQFRQQNMMAAGEGEEGEPGGFGGGGDEDVDFEKLLAGEDEGDDEDEGDEGDEKGGKPAKRAEPAESVEKSLRFEIQV
jgi:hypothetical protein